MAKVKPHVPTLAEYKAGFKKNTMSLAFIMWRMRYSLAAIDVYDFERDAKFFYYNLRGNEKMARLQVSRALADMEKHHGKIVADDFLHRAKIKYSKMCKIYLDKASTKKLKSYPLLQQQLSYFAEPRKAVKTPFGTTQTVEKTPFD